MSIFIQFVQANLALFISAIFALAVLVFSIVALIILKKKQKNAESAPQTETDEKANEKPLS